MNGEDISLVPPCKQEEWLVLKEQQRKRERIERVLKKKLDAVNQQVENKLAD